jgi:hypothetical protein
MHVANDEVVAVAVIETPRPFKSHKGLLFTTAAGDTFVFHNDLLRGVVQDSLDAFADGHGWRFADEPVSLRPTEVARRAKEVFATPYHLTRWNCEHFSRWATGRSVRSPQIQRAGAIAVLLGVALIAVRGLA